MIPPISGTWANGNLPATERAPHPPRFPRPALDDIARLPQLAPCGDPHDWTSCTGSAARQPGAAVLEVAFTYCGSAGEDKPGEMPAPMLPRHYRARATVSRILLPKVASDSPQYTAMRGRAKRPYGVAAP